MPFRPFNRFVVVILLAAAVAALPAGPSSRAEETFEMSEVSVITDKGRFDFSVELADTPARQAQGLQHRRALPASAGMLFNMGRDRVVTMWMKDTPLSLDMLFIDASGYITRIAENTTPFSTATISSGQPVRAVLELNAGTARRIGAGPGDQVLHAMFEGG